VRPSPDDGEIAFVAVRRSSTCATVRGTRSPQPSSPSKISTTVIPSPAVDGQASAPPAALKDIANLRPLQIAPQAGVLGRQISVHGACMAERCTGPFPG
jgi:hypothetical protein